MGFVAAIIIYIAANYWDSLLLLLLLLFKIYFAAVAVVAEIFAAVLEGKALPDLSLVSEVGSLDPLLL